jgi:hypothetical protein
VTDHTGQTDAFWNMAWPAMKTKIITAQSSEVDVVAGATGSSNGIKSAVEAALRKANALPVLETGSYEDVGAAMWHATSDVPSMLAPLLASTAKLEVQPDGKEGESGRGGNAYFFKQFGSYFQNPCL